MVFFNGVFKHQVVHIHECYSISHGCGELELEMDELAKEEEEFLYNWHKVFQLLL